MTMMMKRSSLRRAVVVTALAVCTVMALASPAAASLPEGDAPEYDIIPGPGVTSVGWISDYHPPLADTPADTPVYFLEGDDPGGTLFVLGGNHPSEPAGILAAALIVERAVVTHGRVVIVPYGNPLAVTPEDRVLTYDTAGGERQFVYGVRRSLTRYYNDEDPEEYEGPSGRTLPGRERRNLNRVWPGVEDGAPTEQIAWAIVELMKDVDADIAFDLHETSNLGGTLAWTLAGRSEYRPLIRSAVSSMNETIGLDLMRRRVTDTPAGLSRVEWGPATGAKAFLTETVTNHVTPMEVRIAVQIECVRTIVDAFNKQVAGGDEAIRFTGVPAYDALAERDPGLYFQPARDLEQLEPAAAVAVEAEEASGSSEADQNQ